MRATNFTWRDSIHIGSDGNDYDLHNHFDFRQFTYNPTRQLATLEWKRGTGEWIPEGQPQRIILRFEGVSEYSFRERDPAMPFSEDVCLASFGYVCEEECADGQFMVDKKPEDHWAWSFIFQSGAEIRITGEVATIEIVRE